MSTLMSCFKCGKAILVDLETQAGKTPYCSMCKMSLGIQDAPPAKPKPETGVQKLTSPPAARQPQSSPKAASGQLASAAKQRSTSSKGGGLSGGLIVAIVFGAIAIGGGAVLAIILANPDDSKQADQDRSNGGQVSGPPGGQPGPKPGPPGQPPVEVPKQLIPQVVVPLIRTIRVSDTGVFSVAYSPDGTTLATASGYLRAKGELRLWDAATGDRKSFVASPGSDLFGVAFRKNGNLLAAANGDTGLQFYDLRTRRVRTFRHPSYVRGLAFSPSGDRVASSCENNLKVWDVATGQEMWTANLQGELKPWRIPTRMAFSPDGNSVAAGNGGRDVVIHDAGSGQARLICRGHRDTVLCTLFSPDGRFLVSGSFDHTIKVWDPATGNELRTLDGHRDWVFGVALARDGRTLASAGREGAVILWDVPAARKLVTLAAHAKEAVGVAFSPDGKTLATAGVDGVVHLWDVSHIVGVRH